MLDGTLLKEVFREFQPKLVASLPLKDVIFVSILAKNDFFVDNQTATIKAQKTKADKASYFLNNVIFNDIEKYFVKLLNVMEVYGDKLEGLANEIKEKLGISKCNFENVHDSLLHIVCDPVWQNQSFSLWDEHLQTRYLYALNW